MTQMPTLSGSIGLAASDSDTYTPEVLLLAGSLEPQVSYGTLADVVGVLPAYSLVGRVTANGNLILSLPGASDGSQFPVGVTTHASKDVGATQRIGFYRSGSFNFDAVNMDDAWTLNALRIAVEASGAELYFDTRKTATPTEPVGE